MGKDSRRAADLSGCSPHLILTQKGARATSHAVCYCGSPEVLRDVPAL